MKSQGAPLYVAAAAARRADVLALAYACTCRPGGAQGVVVRISRDGGVLWSRETPVDSLMPGTATVVAVAVGHGGTVFTAWQERGETSRIVVRAQDQADSPWTLQGTIAYEGFASRLQLLTDDCGDLHLLFDRFRASGVWVSYVRRHGRDWGELQRPFGELQSFDPSMAVMHDELFIAAMRAHGRVAPPDMPSQRVIVRTRLTCAKTNAG